MKHINIRSSVSEFILFVTLLAACGTAQTEQPSAPSLIPLTSPPSTPGPTVTITPTETIASRVAPPEHRIGIRWVDGVGEFYNRATGEKFIPRGNNFIRVAEQRSLSGSMMVYHSTFNVGLYDLDEAEVALTRMHSEGYNVVRIFLNGNCADCIGDPLRGVSAAYVANLTDFLRKAEANEIFVILTTDAEPATRYYIDLLDSTWSQDWGGTNSNILRGGGIQVGRTFWTDLISGADRPGCPHRDDPLLPAPQRVVL